jgi:hypothetical protein
MLLHVPMFGAHVRPQVRQGHLCLEVDVAGQEHAPEIELFHA